LRLKLDENLGRTEAEFLRAAGHDVDTVVDEGLMSASDATVIDAARAAGRGLVTLDLDFSNPLRFDPRAYAGIAVLRLPRRPARDDLRQALTTLVRGLERQPFPRRLWIVQAHAIREYQPPHDD
jgi:hypothetical protein